MGRTGIRLASFCLHRVTTHVLVRSPPQPIHHTRTIFSNSINANMNLPAFSSNGENKVVGDAAGKPLPGRKIMIVVDSSVEAKAAVQWALTHTVQSQDTIVLLHVTRPSSMLVGEECNRAVSPGVYELLFSMKNMCHMNRPEVQVEVASVEGKDKGIVIVQEAKKQGVSLLVLGQRKRCSMTWRQLMMWTGHKVIRGGVVEYCIQNSHCMAIAVRRKSRKLGGYLITTKRHKDFWLLA
ncbi:universal stress protein PHOS32-like [Telopea speciosissima]|uniref:universal stress protein PHOS32-like n=1 Tax=Telopea speciosissima TaxID=54955 RepID=UPI001CC65840|nr:universal stress protein PHOS32-like [Telopea speciosissima]